MRDLTEYDRAIVEAAEAWHDEEFGKSGFAMEANLVRAVQAKRYAQRPLCTFYDDESGDFCGEPAVQTWDSRVGPHYRCDEHRIEVREL